jgi:hypothetical protein
MVSSIYAQVQSLRSYQAPLTYVVTSNSVCPDKIFFPAKKSMSGFYCNSLMYGLDVRSMSCGFGASTIVHKLHLAPSSDPGFW